MAQEWLKQKGSIKDIVCVSPDAGAIERTRAFAKKIQSPIALMDKRRPHPNQAEVCHIIGDIEGKTALIIDDMIDTAGTLCGAVDSLLAKGAKAVYALSAHAVFSDPGYGENRKKPLERGVG